MKSIIEQASSIIKAIEKAWNQAEKPKDFSIKIFEHEERNFFGMSTKPAKVGIFFGSDKVFTQEKPVSKPQQKIKECRPAAAKAMADKPSFSKVEDTVNKEVIRTSQLIQKTQQAQPKQAASSVKHDNQSPQPKVHSSEKIQQVKSVDGEYKLRRIPTTWNDTMITTAHNWLKKTLSLMGLPSIDFNSEIAGKNLKLTFNAPLIADPIQEKQLFRSFAHLIMSSLRNQYKQEIKHLKVVLIRPE